MDLQPIAYILFSATPLIFTRWFFSTNHKDTGTLYFVFGAWSGMVGTSLRIYTTLKMGVVMFGGTVCKHLPDCTAAHPRRPYSWSILAALSVSTCSRVHWFTWQGNVDATPNEVLEVRKAAAKACFSVFPRLGLNRMGKSIATVRLRIMETGSFRK